MPKALNYLHDLLTLATLEEKCQKYAVLLSLAAATRVPYESDVLELVTIDYAVLSRQYHAINVTELSSLYMSATEKYRVTRLGPAFIEIIECLKMMHTPLVEKYLSNIELKITLDLYKRVLGKTDGPMDVDSLDLMMVHPTFLANLRKLFEGQLDIDELFGMSHVQKSGRSLTMGPADFTNTAGQVNPDLQLGTASSGETKRVSRQKAYRERNRLRMRERSRITLQRLRLLNPEAMREQNRIHKQQYRERKKQRKEQAMLRNRILGELKPEGKPRKERQQELLLQNLDLLLNQPRTEPEQNRSASSLPQMRWQTDQRPEQVPVSTHNELLLHIFHPPVSRSISQPEPNPVQAPPAELVRPQMQFVPLPELFPPANPTVIPMDLPSGQPINNDRAPDHQAQSTQNYVPYNRPSDPSSRDGH